MKNENVLLEYVSRLSDDDLHYLCQRFAHNIGGDRAEIANFVGRNRSMDRWLSSANGSNEWFDMIDLLGNRAKEELECREKERKAEQAV